MDRHAGPAGGISGEGLSRAYSPANGFCPHRSAKEFAMQLNPYLTFNGNCEAAFKFYEKVLGGKIVAMISHQGTPAEQHVPPEWRTKIMHARLAMGGEVLMGSDAPPERYEEMKGFSVTLGIDDPADA